MALVAFAYQTGSTVLHRAPAPLKFLVLVLVSAGAFVGFPFGCLVALSVVMLGTALARVPFTSLLRGCTGIFFMALLTVFTRTLRFNPIAVDYAGLLSGLGFASGLVVSFFAAGLFFALTTLSQLKEALDAIPLRPVRRFGLGLTLMLGFLPRFFEKWEAAGDAYKARAGKQGPAKLFVIVPLVIELMIQGAVETALAMEARGT